MDVPPRPPRGPLTGAPGRRLSRRHLITQAAVTGAAAAAMAGAGAAAPADAQAPPLRLGTTLEKIKRAGQFSVGGRQEVFPFGYLDKDKHWVGFSTDLAREVHARIQNTLQTSIRLRLVPVTSRTRIPLLVNGTVDMDAGTTVVTLSREEVVDFSIPFFMTGLQLLVPKGSPVKNVRDLAGKRMGTVQGGWDTGLAQQFAEAGVNPPVNVIAFQDHPDGFQALVNGAIDAYNSDGVILAGLKHRAPRPDDWVIIDTGLVTQLYALAMRQNDSQFRHLLNTTLVDLFENGGYLKYYNQYLGPTGALPLPVTDDLRVMIRMNSWRR